jgi:hypothetical protein
LDERLVDDFQNIMLIVYDRLPLVTTATSSAFPEQAFAESACAFGCGALDVAQECMATTTFAERRRQRRLGSVWVFLEVRVALTSTGVLLFLAPQRRILLLSLLL